MHTKIVVVGIRCIQKVIKLRNVKITMMRQIRNIFYGRAAPKEPFLDAKSVPES